MRKRLASSRRLNQAVQFSCLLLLGAEATNCLRSTTLMAVSHAQLCVFFTRKANLLYTNCRICRGGLAAIRPQSRTVTRSESLLKPLARSPPGRRRRADNAHQRGSSHCAIPTAPRPTTLFKRIGILLKKLYGCRSI